VHFDIDDEMADKLAHEWRRLGLSRVPLEIVACPDRRLRRTAVETVAHELSDGETEVSVLIPDKKYRGLWHRILHDRTADQILAEVSRLPHANVTTVPFQFDTWSHDAARDLLEPVQADTPRSKVIGLAGRRPRRESREVTPIGEAQWRDKVRIQGQVRSLRVAPQRDVPVFECVVDDGTGTIRAVFLGRRDLGGVACGTRLELTGTVGVHHSKLAILNPSYTVLSPAPS
jgi:hypothetical protein